jgi:hypothetical protein
MIEAERKGGAGTGLSASPLFPGLVTDLRAFCGFGIFQQTLNNADRGVRKVLLHPFPWPGNKFRIQWLHAC